MLRLQACLVAVCLALSGDPSPRKAKGAEKPSPMWELPPLLTAKPLAENRDDDVLLRLLKARYNEAVSETKAYYTTRQKAAELGGDFVQDQDSFYRMWERLIRAGMDVHEKQSDKVALLAQYLDVTKDLEKLEQARVESGRNPPSLLRRARYERLNAEIRLLRAKREAEREKGK